MRKKCQESLINRGIWVSIERIPTTDCREIREERSNDKIGNLVIFYSLESRVVSMCLHYFLGWNSFFPLTSPPRRDTCVPTCTQHCVWLSLVPGKRVARPVGMQPAVDVGSIRGLQPRSSEPIHMHGCLYPSSGRHHSFPKPACIHFHNFLFHYNINGTINGKGQEKHF